MYDNAVTRIVTAAVLLVGSPTVSAAVVPESHTGRPPASATAVPASPGPKSQVSRQPPPALDPGAIFERAKAVFRAVRRPPYIVYTVERRETIDGMPDFQDTYSLRVWCRTSDDSALARRTWRGKTYGDLELIHPLFNAPIDPGPPTADIFQPAPLAANVEPAQPSPAPPVLVDQTVRGELDYRVTLADIDDGAYHLRLVAMRDPDRNRLREIWVDERTFAVRRLIANDTLFYVGTGLSRPEIFDVTLSEQNGIPIVQTIHSVTENGFVAGSIDLGLGTERGDYTFEDVAFPQTLPSLYFEPQLYGRYVREAPGA